MRIVLIIMANVMVVVVSVLGVNEFFGLKRYHSFTLPFTDKMVAHGVIPAEKRDALVKNDRIVHLVGVFLSLLVWIMLARFIAGVSAIPVFLLAVAYQLIALKPDMGETPATRNQYFNAHKNDMDAIQYQKYLKSVETPHITEK